MQRPPPTKQLPSTTKQSLRLVIRRLEEAGHNKAAYDLRRWRDSKKWYRGEIKDV